MFCPVLECLTSDVNRSYHPKPFNYIIYTGDKMEKHKLSREEVDQLDQLETDGVELRL